MRKSVIVEHCFGEPGSGGPIASLERLLDSPLTGKYDFVRMQQEGTTGGIDHRRIHQWVRMLRALNPDLVHVRGLGNEGFHVSWLPA